MGVPVLINNVLWFLRECGCHPGRDGKRQTDLWSGRHTEAQETDCQRKMSKRRLTCNNARIPLEQKAIERNISITFTDCRSKKNSTVVVAANIQTRAAPATQRHRFLQPLSPCPPTVAARCCVVATPSAAKVLQRRNGGLQQSSRSGYHARPDELQYPPQPKVRTNVRYCSIPFQPNAMKVYRRVPVI